VNNPVQLDDNTKIQAREVRPEAYFYVFYRVFIPAFVDLHGYSGVYFTSFYPITVRTQPTHPAKKSGLGRKSISWMDQSPERM
jgi:hypothetical protein